MEASKANVFCQLLLRGVWCNSVFLQILQKQTPEVFFKKKVLLKILHNSEEYTCIGVSFLIKLFIHKSSTPTKILELQVWIGDYKPLPPDLPPWVTQGNFLTCLGRHGKHVWLIVRQLPIKTGWWDARVTLRGLAEKYAWIKPGTQEMSFQLALNKICFTSPPLTHQKCFTQFTRRHAYRSLFVNKVVGLKFPCEFWQIFENTFITEHLRATASSVWKKYMQVFTSTILLTFNNRNTITMCEICSKLATKTPKRQHYKNGQTHSNNLSATALQQKFDKSYGDLSRKSN